MSAIYKFGSEAQKQRWLPGMAAGELIGCFGLTEPDAGSDPASMTTDGRRDGDGWVINGAKRWIGLASIADVAVIWAQDRRRRSAGFLVPTSHPGFTATPDRTETGHARLDPVRHHAWSTSGCPPTPILPGATGPQRPVLLPERGPLRHHVGRHGRRPRRLRDSSAATRWTAASSTSRSRRSSSPSKSWSTWCWKSRRASSSRCRPDG